ncbi:MAG: hypothetical protein NXI01_00745 [Gammaproteobacteria bacterium]|nr:hypothetical protein [Gammaproteobacteria bacterium]
MAEKDQQPLNAIGLTAEDEDEIKKTETVIDRKKARSGDGFANESTACLSHIQEQLASNNESNASENDKLAFKSQQYAELQIICDANNAFNEQGIDADAVKSITTIIGKVSPSLPLHELCFNLGKYTLFLSIFHPPAGIAGFALMALGVAIEFIAKLNLVSNVLKLGAKVSVKLFSYFDAKQEQDASTQQKRAKTMLEDIKAAPTTDTFRNDGRNEDDDHSSQHP